MARIRCAISSMHSRDWWERLARGSTFTTSRRRSEVSTGRTSSIPAPLGAPTAMSLSGLIGFLAERVRDNKPEGESEVFGLPAGRVVAATTAMSLLGSTAEAGLLHFRGAFHNPVGRGEGTQNFAALDGCDRGDGRRRRRIPRLWRLARHGWVAQLAAERHCRPSAPRAALVHRLGTCRPRRFGTNGITWPRDRRALSSIRRMAFPAPEPSAWEAIRARASSMPIAEAGIYLICGCAMDRYFRPSAASIRH